MTGSFVSVSVRKRICFLLILTLFLFVITSCTSTFALEEPSEAPVSQMGIITGTLSFGSGFFFPSDSTLLDISLLETDGITGVISEISHQRIRNIQRFPVQFTVRYDISEVSSLNSYRLLITLTQDGAVKAQAIGEVLTKGFSNTVSTTLSQI